MSRVIKKKLNKTAGNLKQRFFILKIVAIAGFFLLSGLRPALAIDGIMNGKTITGETDNFLFWLQTYDSATSPYFFDKFFIDKAGNVGIGTTNPTIKLDVNGAFRSTSATISTIGAGIIMADSSGNLFSTSTAVATGIPSPAGITGQTLRSNGTNWIANNLLYNNGTNVGIGTTAPLSKLSINGGLHVGGDSDALDNNLLVDGTINGLLVNQGTNSIAGNTAVGALALDGANSGTGMNTAIGNSALTSNTSGNSNAAFGQNALYSNTTGYENTANGRQALQNNTSGAGNTASGDMSLFSNITGSSNTAIGSGALFSTTGYNNVALGYYAGKYETGSNAFYVNNIEQANTAADKAYSLLYGTFSGTAGSLTGQQLVINGNVGIGTTAPGVKLDVNGALRSSSATISTIGAGIIMADSSGNLFSTSTSVASGIPSPAGISGQTLRSNGTNWIANNLLYNNGTNVGIGTTNPTALLNPYKSADVTLSINTTYAVNVTQGADGLLAIGGDANYSYIQSFNSKPLQINNQGNNVILNANGGNVGIGTTSPVYKLDVIGTSHLGGQITTSLSGTGSRCLHVDANGVMGVMAGDCGTSTGGDNLGTHIATQNIQLGNYWLSGDGGSEGVFVKSDGNVGIGTTAPAKALEIFRTGEGAGKTQLRLSTGSSLYWDIGRDQGNGNFELIDQGGNNRFTIDQSNGNVGIGTTAPGVKFDVNGALRSSSATISTIGTGIIMADSSGNLYSSSTLAMSGLTLSGDLNMSGHDIKNVNKLTVVTIDPLYNLKGVNYSTYAPSISGGVKEEYVGKIVINSRNPKNKNEYEKIINFSAEPVGSDLWVWRNVVDYNFENVEVIMTPYGNFANTYYLIENNQLIFRSDKSVTLSYRLIGNRFDWRKWPTRAIDQSEPGMKVE